MSTREDLGCAKIAPFNDKLTLIEEWADELKDWLDSAEDIHGASKSRVENIGYDGFHPYTEGGFDIIGYSDLDACHSSGSAPALIQPYIDRAVKDAEEEWDREHPECTVAMIYGSHDDPDQPQLPGTPPRPEPYEAQREEFYEHQDTWMREGGTFFYKARVLLYAAENHRNETGEHEALFCVGLNDDFEYGRDSVSWLPSPSNGGPGTHWLWEKTIPVRRLTEARIKVLVRMATRALEAA